MLGKDTFMHENSAEALLAHIEKSQRVTKRYSLDNGIVLMAWGLNFFLDMVGFDVSRITGSVVPGVIFIVVLNAAFLAWRFWYARRLPIRPLRVLTNKIVFFWSFYYVALVLLGVGAWIIFIGPYPPFWFTLLGVLGALPLLISGWLQWRVAHK